MNVGGNPEENGTFVFYKNSIFVPHKNKWESGSTDKLRMWYWFARAQNCCVIAVDNNQTQEHAEGVAVDANKKWKGQAECMAPLEN